MNTQMIKTNSYTLGKFPPPTVANNVENLKTVHLKINIKKKINMKQLTHAFILTTTVAEAYK